MEPEPIIKQYGAIEVELEVSPMFEDRDVVLSSLKQQLADRLINDTEFAERRRAYLEKLLPTTQDQEPIANS